MKEVLYELKQAPRAWYRGITSIFKIIILKGAHMNMRFIVKVNKNEDMLIVCMYIDDLIFKENNSSMLDEYKRTMTWELKMSNLELMAYYFGKQVKQSDEDIFVSQECYTKEMLKKLDSKTIKHTLR